VSYIRVITNRTSGKISAKQVISEFLKGLQAETGVEIVVDNVDEIVSFSGDFLSISRANEIISQFTKQLNEV
jgi:hypothetical protein